MGTKRKASSLRAEFQNCISTLFDPFSSFTQSSVFLNLAVSALKKMSGTRLSVIDPLCEAK